MATFGVLIQSKMQIGIHHPVRVIVIVCFFRTSHAEKVIQFPYKGVTSITFGSDDDLYATLASAPIDLFTLKVYHRNNIGSSLLKVTGLRTDGTTFKPLKI